MFLYILQNFSITQSHLSYQNVYKYLSIQTLFCRIYKTSIWLHAVCLKFECIIERGDFENLGNKRPTLFIAIFYSCLHYLKEHLQMPIIFFHNLHIYRGPPYLYVKRYLANLRAWFRDFDIIGSWIRDQRLLRAAWFVKNLVVISWNGLLKRVIDAYFQVNQTENHKFLAMMWF